MARRNRKKRRLNAYVMPARFAGLVVLFSALALASVWMDCRCEAVGEAIQKLEGERVGLENRLFNEECRWARVKSPVSIERALLRCRLAMTLPRRNQIVRVDGAGPFPDPWLDFIEDGNKVVRLERVRWNE